MRASGAPSYSFLLCANRLILEEELPRLIDSKLNHPSFHLWHIVSLTVSLQDVRHQEESGSHMRCHSCSSLLYTPLCIPDIICQNHSLLPQCNIEDFFFFFCIYHLYVIVSCKNIIASKVERLTADAEKQILWIQVSFT